MGITISFHGAVETVTGSCHLLQAGGLRILVDCGMFQGGRKWEDKNYEDFGFDPASLDYLLLTHGHLDHAGGLTILDGVLCHGEPTVLLHRLFVIAFDLSHKTCAAFLDAFEIREHQFGVDGLCVPVPRKPFNPDSGDVAAEAPVPFNEYDGRSGTCGSNCSS